MKVEIQLRVAHYTWKKVSETSKKLLIMLQVWNKRNLFLKNNSININKSPGGWIRTHDLHFTGPILNWITELALW